MDKRTMVVVDDLIGYRIRDVETKKFIGFQFSNKKLKTIWNKENHAKSAFKAHTGVFFRDQSKYEIVKV